MVPVIACDAGSERLHELEREAKLRYATRNRPKCWVDDDCKAPSLCPAEMTGWCGGYRGGARVQGYCSCTPLRRLPNPDGGAPVWGVCDPNPDGGAPSCAVAEDAEMFVGDDGSVSVFRDAGRR